jgi:hypothetical protein
MGLAAGTRLALGSGLSLGAGLAAGARSTGAALGRAAVEARGLKLCVVTGPTGGKAILKVLLVADTLLANGLLLEAGLSGRLGSLDVRAFRLGSLFNDREVAVLTKIGQLVIHRGDARAI